MKKNRLYILIAILTIVFFFGTAQICPQCGRKPEEKVGVGEETAAEESQEIGEKAEEVTGTEESKEASLLDVSVLAGKNVTSATLELKDPDLTANPCNFKGRILVFFVDFLPGGLTVDDWGDIPYGGPFIFNWDATPLRCSSNFLISTIVDRASVPRKLQFSITYENPATGGIPGVPEGRVYYPNDITLTVTYTE